jgi:opacity protein-like surface antigen
MKKLTVLLCFVLLAVTAVSAQNVKPFNFYLGAGGSVPSGDFGNGYKFGYHAMFGFGFKMMPSLELVPKVEFHAFPLDKSGFTGTISGGNTSALMFGGDVRYSFPLPTPTLKPYALAGIGLASFHVSEMTWDNVTWPSGSTSKMYYNIGAGVEFAAGPAMSLFVQARYVSISTDQYKSNYIPITVGLKF